MKTYEPRRNNECPNGLHADYDPAKDPTQNECTCPWLIIQSTTPVQHITSWNRRETENVIREMDRGYFDPPGYPKRTGSMFLSPAMQRLLDVAEKSPVAAALTLLAGSGSGLPPFDAIAWDAEDACLSLRTTPPVEHHENATWRRLHLGHANVDAVTDEGYEPGGANPVLLWADHPDTARETGLVGFYPRPEETSGDVYAEGGENLAECQIDGTCCGTCNADFGTCCTHEPSPVKTTPAQVLAMAQEADDIAADSTTARIMGDYMPLILTVPADEIPNMKPGHPIYDQAVAAVEALPQRVPQVPSDIAEAGHGDDYCTCDLNLRYMCPTCRAAQDDTPITITRGGVQFPADVPEDVFHAAQVKECGWALVDNAGTFVCTLPANHGNNHSDGGRAWYDSGTDDCTCATRGSAPDTYACPEHPADV